MSAVVCACVCVCALQVKLPHVDWARVLEVDMQHAPSMKLAQGYERLHMPGGIQVRNMFVCQGPCSGN